MALRELEVEFHGTDTDPTFWVDSLPDESITSLHLTLGALGPMSLGPNFGVHREAVRDGLTWSAFEDRIIKSAKITITYDDTTEARSLDY